MTTIKSSPSFLARPFDGFEVFADSLNASVVKIGSDVYEPGFIELPITQLPLREGQVEIYFDQSLPDNLEKLGIDLKIVDLICFIEGSVIAESQILFKKDMRTAKSPVVLPIEGNPLITQSPNGFDIKIALILTKDREAKGRQLIENGVWLTNTIFRLKPYTAQSMFAPAPLDDQVRASFGLPRACMTYIHVQEDFLFAESLEDQVDIYIDVSILRLLQENNDSAIANSIQLDLAASLFLALIGKAANQLREENLEDSEGFAIEDVSIGKVLNLVSISSKYSTRDLLKFGESDLGRLKAAIESYLNTLKLASMALREVS